MPVILGGWGRRTVRFQTAWTPEWKSLSKQKQKQLMINTQKSRLVLFYMHSQYLWVLATQKQHHGLLCGLGLSYSMSQVHHILSSLKNLGWYILYHENQQTLLKEWLFFVVLLLFFEILFPVVKPLLTHH